MNIDIDIFDFSESGRKLWNLEDYPQAELYFEMAYQAVMDKDIHLAMEYFMKTVKTLQNGNALTVLDGKKPQDEGHDYSKRAKLVVVR